MTVRFHRDYETRSACDLRKAGVHVYARDVTTGVWCMAYAVDDAPVKLWTPGQPCPPEFVECSRNPEWVAVAHNDAFETTIETEIMAEFYGWPIIPRERHRCTMVEALAMGLPASLENMAAALGMDERKDMDGRKVMMQMSRPRKINPDGSIVWWDDDRRKTILYDYCRNDVVVERSGEHRLLRLSDAEQEVWILDQEINDRGIYIDLAAVDAAIAIVEGEKARLNAEMCRVTRGAVAGCSNVADLLAWAKSQGADLDGVAKADVTDALDDPKLPAQVRRALELRREAARSSTAKLKAMRASVGADGRARGAFQYHAAHTGRFGGRRIQFQNFIKAVLLKQPQIESVLELLGG